MRLLLGRKCHEDLIGGCLGKDLITLCAERLTQLCRQRHGVAGNIDIEVVGEQHIELNTQHTTLCQQGALLLDGGEEVGNKALAGYNHRLAKHSTALGATDIEYIRKACQIP